MDYSVLHRRFDMWGGDAGHNSHYSYSLYNINSHGSMFHSFFKF